jgi:spoIIIJ-associated protein
VAESRKPPELDGALILDAEPDLDDDDRDDRDERAEPRELLPLDHDPREDGKADLASEMLIEILKRMSLAAEITVREDAEEVIIDVAGEDAGRVIGKKGQTLDALQFLINKIVNRFPEGRRHIVLDSGDYRQRRENGLASMARREAKRAVQQSRIITLEPMSPRDRRVIHLSLAKFPGVSTRSDGQGNERRVRIIPARQARPERQPRRPRMEDN